MKVWTRSSGEGRSGRNITRAGETSPAEPVPGAGPDASQLEDALRRAQAMQWRYNLARTELDRLRQELSTAQEAREEQDARRAALVEAVADSVPSAMLNSRRQGWDEGWEAAQVGLPKSMNPHRDSRRAGSGTVPD